MSIDLRWLGTSCFQLVLPGDIRIILDPYMDDSPNSPIQSGEIEHCDYIFITHGHWDHVLDVGKLAMHFTPPIYCNRDTAKSIVEHQQVDKTLIHTITRGDIIQLPGFTVEVLMGVHTNQQKEFKRVFGREFPDPKHISDPLERMKIISKANRGTDQIPEAYPQWNNMYFAGEQLNFIFEGKDGQRVFVAGSYPDPRVIKAAEKVNADITLLQCMSANMLQGIEHETADIAIASGCKTVIPQHHDPIFKGGWETDLSILKQILKDKSDMVFFEIVPGSWHTFEDGRVLKC